jgi:hypothetical protein
VEKYKSGLVAKGYSQVEGIDFGEIFSPVAKLTSIRFILSITATFDIEVEQMDVKTTFLHGDLEEEIYMKQPEGFVVKGKKELVCKLKKSLYGWVHFPYFRVGSTSNFSIKFIIEIIYFVFTLNYNTLITSLYYLPFKIS